MLHYAASNRNMDIVSLLLDTGICDINHQNKTGCTAVMMAALTEVRSDQQQEVVRQLFEMGDVNIQAPSGDGNELVRHLDLEKEQAWCVIIIRILLCTTLVHLL